MNSLLRSRRTATLSAASILLIVACSLDQNDENRTSALVSTPPWDADALVAFTTHGVAPPRTVRTGESDAVVDVSALRDAIADPRALTKDERQALESGDEEAEAEEALSEVGYTGGDNGVFDEGGVATTDDSAVPAQRVFAGPSTPPPPPMASPMPNAEPVEDPAHVEGRLRASERPSGAPASERTEAKLEDRLDSDGSPEKLVASTVAKRSVGKVLFRNAEGRFESLTPRAFRLQVILDGPRARTTVEYVFQNPHDRSLEGTFHYTLPAGASPAHFGMFRGGAVVDASAFGTAPLLPTLAIPGAPARTLDQTVPAADIGPRNGPPTLIPDWGERQTARVVEQKRARQVYESIVRENIDPALLEWAGGNTFKARVFPIEAHSTKRVFLVFEETLPLDSDVMRYHHALPSDPELGEIEVHIQARAANLRLARLAGRTLTGPGTSANGSTKTSSTGSSTGTNAETTSSNGWTSLALRYRPGDQEAIDLVLQSPDIDRQVLVESNPSDLGGAAFFARVRPDLPRRERTAPTGRALFVVDTSLSSDGPYRGLSADLIRGVLENDETIDAYAVLLFDIRARWLHSASWRPNDEPSRNETMTELDRVYLEGATSFSSVLSEIDAQSAWLKEPGRVPTAFLISDGEITWGQDRIPMLLRKAGDSAPLRWISFELGTVASNRALFEGLASRNEGRTVNVLSKAQIGQASTAHRTAPAVLKEVRIIGEPASDLTIAGDPRLLFSGQDLRIAGRLSGNAAGATLEVELQMDGVPIVTRIPLREGASSSFAGRAFAELYAERLLSYDDERLHRMVVALSQRFSLANQAASMLILDQADDWERFDLKNEQVDLTNLEILRAQEEDQRLDKAQGIGVDEVPAKGRALIRALQDIDVPDYLREPKTPLLDRPLAGAENRIQAEIAYREKRPGNEMELDVYRSVAFARAEAGDTLGALRAWSSLVETRPGDTEAGRLVGYACLALGQYGPAAELFERIRLKRPFEPQAFLEEALALEAAGHLAEAARRYEIVLARPFARHQNESRIVGTRHYARLLNGVLRDIPSAPTDAIQSRLTELAAIPGVPAIESTDLQVTLEWTSDSVDIDLWIIEPEGERCYYGHKDTAAGGHLLWDVTDGYGPELYHRPEGRGEFEVAAHFYGNNSARWAVPTGALIVVDRGLYRAEDQFTRRFQCFVLGKQDAVLSLSKEHL